jgi:hypothetical protein
VGAAFFAGVASESVADRQPRSFLLNDFYDFNDLMNKRIDEQLPAAELKLPAVCLRRTGNLQNVRYESISL